MIRLNWTDEQKNRIIELSKQGLSSPKVAQQMFDEYGTNFSRRTVARFIATGQTSSQYKRKPKPKVKDVKRGTEIVINKDGSTTSSTTMQMTEEQAKDPDFVLRAHGFNPDDWDIVSARNNFWQQNSVENGLIDLYQSKITVKPKVGLKTSDVIDALNHRVKPIKIQNVKSGKNNLIIPIYDAHFGWQKYKNIKKHLEQIIEVMEKGYNEIHIILGGDYFHSDYINKSQTVKNTQIDHVNNRLALNDGTRFISELIESAAKYSNAVSVHAVPGNHDADKQYMFVWGLQFKYPEVKFFNTENKRSVFSMSNVGVMLAHGDFALKRLPMLFATEYPQIWSDSTYRIVITGHFHQNKLTDENGVLMLQSGTAKPTDNYEDDNGFDMSHKKIQVLEFNNKRLVATFEIE